MRVLVVLGSRAEIVERLLELERWSRVVVLTTALYEGEATAARDLLGERVAEGYMVRVLEVDPNDPLGWQRAVSEAIQAEQAGSDDITVDVTGGTKPMTIGAYAASELCGVPAVYLASQWSEDRVPRASEIRPLPAVRVELGLDLLAAADAAFALGHFDAARVLYEKLDRRKVAPAAGVLEKLAKARLAWVHGHHGNAVRSYPSQVGRTPTPWAFLHGRMAAREASPSALDEDAMGAWLRDRLAVLDLLLRGGHAGQDVAGVAWGLIEAVARWLLRQSVEAGATITNGQGVLEADDLGTGSDTKITLGPLLGLLIDGRSGGMQRLWQGKVPSRVERAQPALGGLRGTKREGKYQGLEVRNGLAHGYASDDEVAGWNKHAVGAGGHVVALVTALGLPERAELAPGRLEDPAGVRAAMAASG